MRSATRLALACCLALVAATQAAVVYQGCWANAADELRALPFKAAANDFMTPDYCRRLALNRFVQTMGLEWGRECWLDPSNGDLAMVTRFGASPNCTMPCSGDVTTRCGGDYTDDIYTITDPLPASVPARNVTHLGCFKDDQLDRRMTLLWESNSSMSIDLCAHIAYAEEWPFFAVQWGKECWGGKEKNHSSSLGPATNCDIPCPGNANQTCGGALALNVYQVLDQYWDVPDYESPWDAPKPAPPATPPSATVSLLTAADCTGAAASSPACKTVLQSGAAAAATFKLAGLLAVVLAAGLLG